MNTLGIGEIAAMTRAEAEAAIRARVQTVPVGDHLMLARVLGHSKMFLDTRDLGFSCHVMMDGYWEIWLTLCLARLTKPGMGVIDVGANFGYYSLLMGLGSLPGGQLISVEPNPDVFASMARTLRLNGLAASAKLVKAAAGAASGERLLYVPEAEPKNASLVPEPLDSADGVCVRVPVVTIDSLASDMSRVDIVKIDAEGGEAEIVVGMAETIRRHKPIIVLEFNAARYADASGFLGQLTASYGLPRQVAFDGTLEPASERSILESNYAEDKLLVFAASESLDGHWTGWATRPWK